MTAEISFLSAAEKLTLHTYFFEQELGCEEYTPISRVVAAALLSVSAALDIAFHTTMIFPTCVYALGKSLLCCELDFVLPWQHLQRVRNAVAPLLLGSVFGLIHPFAGFAVSEPVDKHAVVGMLSSNTSCRFTTPCSPIQSLSIVETIARGHQTSEVAGVRHQIYSDECIESIRFAREFEGSLESLQAQEFIHKITNLTLLATGYLVKEIRGEYQYEAVTREVLIRCAVLLMPILATIDLTFAMLLHLFLLATGVIQFISGRGPIYTEITTNPLMHLFFLLQNIMKVVGTLVATLVGIVEPTTGFKVGLYMGSLFYYMQMSCLMSQLQAKMESLPLNARFFIPIVYGTENYSALSLPVDSMHKTYLIIEKKAGELFNLYWVNRSSVSQKINTTLDQAITVIRPMLDARFPFMNVEKTFNSYPIKGDKPVLPENIPYPMNPNLASQGNHTNCVVSNLFATFETLDRLQGSSVDTTEERYRVTREALMHDYSFYRDAFFPFRIDFNYLRSAETRNASLTEIWEAFEQKPNAAI
ncbi:MAG: hypothetical protein HYX48_02705 [Chlamydiales bacterium]|nr:hypothetical protein [Chlamydiales bacterium]